MDSVFWVLWTVLIGIPTLLLSTAAILFVRHGQSLNGSYHCHVDLEQVIDGN